MTKESVRAEILKLLETHNIPFTIMVHEEATKSNAAAELTGVKLQMGIKSLILRGKKSGKNYLVCILGHQRLEMRAMSAILNESCELERPEIIKEKYGLEIGGIPPFGAILGLKTYFDKSILDCEEVVFSSGLTTESIKAKSDKIVSLVNPSIVAIAKEQ